MSDTVRQEKLREQFASRRALVETSREVFLRTVEISDDPDEIVDAALGSLRAEGELRAIDLAEQALTDLTTQPGATESDRRRGRLAAAPGDPVARARQEVAELTAMIIGARTHAQAAEALRSVVLAHPDDEHVAALVIAAVAQLGVHAVVGPPHRVASLLSRMRVLADALRGVDLAGAEMLVVPETWTEQHTQRPHAAAKRGIPRRSDVSLPSNGSAVDR